MNKIFETLENLLKKDERFVSQDGKVMRNAVYEASNKMDEKLLSLLMSDEKIKEIFFKKVNDIYVYDKQKFNFVINNRQMLPNSYTRYRQDIGLTNSKDDYISATNDVVLSFPFKDCVLEFDSTDPDQKREEIFYNEILAHDEIDHLFSNKVLTNAKLIDKEGEKEIKEFDEDSNLLIKGNNLLALHSLLTRYKGKVKLMYWDILYNTESDYVPYADSFKHSSWLVMIKNRLEVAKQLLRDDGVICLQCDYNEMSYLKVLCDEIFDRDNYVSMVTVKTSSESGVKVNAKKPIKVSEYILIYSKNKDRYNYKHARIITGYDENYKYYVVNEKELVDKWKFRNIRDVLSEELNKAKRDLSNDELRKFQIENKNKVFSVRDISDGLKRFIKEKNINKDKVYKYITSTGKETLLYKNGEIVFINKKISLIDGKEEITKIASDIWIDVSWDGIANEGGIKLKNGKKPERLLQRLLSMFTNENDLVLDVYFGTGTTGAVAMKMGRRFIGIEQLDSHIELAKTRLKNVINGDETGISKAVDWKGGNSFVYCELKKLNENYIESIRKANTMAELNIIWEKIGETGFISCCINNELNEIIKSIDYRELDIDSVKKILIEILDKNQLYVNYEDILDVDFKVSDEDKKFTESFYNVK